MNGREAGSAFTQCDIGIPTTDKRNVAAKRYHYCHGHPDGAALITKAYQNARQADEYTGRRAHVLDTT